MDHLKALIREVPDFPKPGINFYDITTLLKDPIGFKGVIDSLAEHYRSIPIDVVLGIEARGFIIAPAVAYALGYGFIPVRKEKKLPAERERIEYALEYGTDVLEIHKDAISPGQNVLIIDDVLATGGTAAAVARLVETLHGKVAGLGVHPGTRFPAWAPEARGPRRLLAASLLMREAPTQASVRIRSLAKINLDLRVLNKRPDGFHELRSIFQTISLADTIEIEYQRGRTKIELKSNLNIPGNLILRAADILMKAVRATGQLRFDLTKRIPLGGGLGGGSSNAASVLLALPVLLGKRLPFEKLMELGAELGSDVPFYLTGGTAAGIGRGTELYPLPDAPSQAGLADYAGNSFVDSSRLPGASS